MGYDRNVNKRNIGVTVKQLSLVHVAKRDLNLTEEDYRNILELYGGVSSAKHLTLEGLERVMAYFEGLGFKYEPDETKEGTGHVQSVYRASDTKRPPDPKETKTPAQESMLNHYFNQLGIAEPERRQGFSKKVIKKAWPQTRGEAAKLIEGLKAMLARGYVAKGGEAQ